jgi:nucleoside phosphorylase
MELAGTTTLLVALKAEAQPLIDYYKLKSIQQRPFPIFSNGQLKVIVTGVGAYRSATALGYANASSAAPTSHIWINFGIAGHRNHPVGTAVSVSKVINNNNQSSWYPNLIKLPNTLIEPLTTHDQIIKDYTNDTLCDMEGAGFMSAASSLHIKSECLFVFKIISDNQHSKVERITKNLVTKLINTHISTLETLIKKAEEVVQDARNFVTDIDSELLKTWHFSQSQKNQLNENMRRFKALDKQSSWPDINLDECVTAKGVIEKLNRRLLQMLPKF